MKIAAALLASAALASVSASAAIAQVPADTVDPNVPTQLPRTAIPHHYALTVTPHAKSLTFDGKVSIDLDVTKPTASLTLSAADLSFASAVIRPATGGAALNGRTMVNEKDQSATFTFPKMLAPGAYRLDLVYAGTINTQANGLFALDYKNKEGKDARSLFTQFEAADARRFVPSWDEPDYKATWDLTARVPVNEMAVSNLPVATSRNIGNGLKEVRFQTTPIMSSYLLFFATGDFDRISKPAAGREVGIVMSRGNGPKGQLALDSEAQILPYYNEYFGTPYPLPKLDNVAGPGQSQFFGAMENWGAIFTFEYALLNDPAITSAAGRQEIFGIEAHEMAHQWFGDLVTMAWWGDLWLNEGFASWMATKATEHFHPDWGADFDRVDAREGAMHQDAFKSTHAIVQDVRTVEQANQAFDAITYSKGESVLSMLEGYAGPDVWRTGIQAYVRKHAYQNTRTEDLWSAIEGAGARGLGAIARDFTNQPGIPLIKVSAQCLGGQTVATLTQSQYSTDLRQEAAARPLAWQVPVRATTGGALAQVVTNGPTTNLTVGGCGPLLLNPGQTGYYRTLYSPQALAALTGSFARLAPIDQYGLMQEQFDMGMSGYQPVAGGLDLLNKVNSSSRNELIQAARLHWRELYDSFEGDAATQSAIAARTARTFEPKLRKLGLGPLSDEPAINAVTRDNLIGTLGYLEDPYVASEAKRLFSAWLTNPDAIPGSLKQTWLSVIARNADAATWDALHAKAKATTGAVERTSLYQLLGVTRDDALARRALDLALTDEPGKTVSGGMISAVARSHPHLAVEFVLAHLAQVNRLIDISGRSSFMARLAGSSRDASLIPVLQAYAEANLAATDRKPVDQAIGQLQFRSSNIARVRSETAAWLAAHPQG